MHVRLHTSLDAVQGELYAGKHDRNEAGQQELTETI